MRLMLDECMTLRASRLLVTALQLHKPLIESHFLDDYLGKGALDPDWTKLLAEEGNWCVATCDHRNPRGKKAKAKGPPLQLILPARKITGFFLGGQIASLSGFEKARAILYVFPELWQQAQTAPPGSRFKVLMHGSGYRMIPWPVTSTLPLL
jgi:hypothetical protein